VRSSCRSASGLGHFEDRLVAARLCGHRPGRRDGPLVQAEPAAPLHKAQPGAACRLRPAGVWPGCAGVRGAAWSGRARMWAAFRQLAGRVPGRLCVPGVCPVVCRGASRLGVARGRGCVCCLRCRRGCRLLCLARWWCCPPAGCVLPACVPAAGGGQPGGDLRRLRCGLPGSIRSSVPPGSRMSCRPPRGRLPPGPGRGRPGGRRPRQRAGRRWRPRCRSRPGAGRRCARITGGPARAAPAGPPAATDWDACSPRWASNSAARNRKAERDGSIPGGWAGTSHSGCTGGLAGKPPARELHPCVPAGRAQHPTSPSAGGETARCVQAAPALTAAGSWSWFLVLVPGSPVPGSPVPGSVVPGSVVPGSWFGFSGSRSSGLIGAGFRFFRVPGSGFSGPPFRPSGFRPCGSGLPVPGFRVSGVRGSSPSGVPVCGVPGSGFGGFVFAGVFAGVLCGRGVWLV
jgi:hypothetical protein